MHVTGLFISFRDQYLGGIVPFGVPIRMGSHVAVPTWEPEIERSQKESLESG